MKSKLLIFALILFICQSCETTVDSPYQNISFTPLFPIPVPERATATSFASDKKAYVLLGRKDGIHVDGLVDCWEFNSLSGTWAKKADFPGIGRVGAIAEVVNNKAYVGLGYNPAKEIYGSVDFIFSDLWMYDIENNSWVQKTSFPSANYQNNPPLTACSSFTYKNWIYIIGLNAQTTSYKHVWRYNTDTDNWERMSDFKGDARACAVSCNDGDKYYFGLGINSYCRDDWWQYFPETDTWKQLKSIPGKGRVNAVAFSIDHRFFVATGRNFGGTLTDDKIFNDVLEYDANKNCWYNRGSLPVNSGRENAISFVVNNNAYIGFGENDSHIFGDLYVFKP